MGENPRIGIGYVYGRAVYLLLAGVGWDEVFVVEFIECGVDFLGDGGVRDSVYYLTNYVIT